MTTLTADQRAPYRGEIAALLNLELAQLTDEAQLSEDLMLDSLNMMQLITWLENNGVTIASTDALPATVGQVLSLLDRAVAAGISVQMNGTLGSFDSGPTAVGIPSAQPAMVTGRDPLAPVLATQALRLTPVRADDIGFLYALAVEPETGFRWRYRGSAPSMDQFAGQLWNQVLLQYVVRQVSDDRPVGHVVAYGDELSLRHTFVGAVFDPPTTGTGLAAQAVELFLGHLFHTFPLHKIYLEIPGYNWPQLQSGQGTLFQVEGVLREHDYYGGRYWDKYVCAVYPAQAGRAPVADPLITTHQIGEGT